MNPTQIWTVTNVQKPGCTCPQKIDGNGQSRDDVHNFPLFDAIVAGIPRAGIFLFSAGGRSREKASAGSIALFPIVRWLTLIGRWCSGVAPDACLAETSPAARRHDHSGFSASTISAKKGGSLADGPFAHDKEGRVMSRAHSRVSDRAAGSAPFPDPGSPAKARPVTDLPRWQPAACLAGDVLRQ